MSDVACACPKVQRELIERAVSPGSPAPLAGEISEHLESCPACRRYREGLEAARDLFQGPALYSAALKQRVLRAAREAPAGDGRVLAGMVPLALASFAVSIVGPVWLLARTLNWWIPSPELSLLAATALTFVVGSVMSGLCASIVARNKNIVIDINELRLEGRHG